MRGDSDEDARGEDRSRLPRRQVGLSEVYAHPRQDRDVDAIVDERNGSRRPAEPGDRFGLCEQLAVGAGLVAQLNRADSDGEQPPHDSDRVSARGRVGDGVDEWKPECHVWKGGGFGLGKEAAARPSTLTPSRRTAP
jgi:hypothetical protein